MGANLTLGNVVSFCPDITDVVDNTNQIESGSGETGQCESVPGVGDVDVDLDGVFTECIVDELLESKYEVVTSCRQTVILCCTLG